MLVLSRDRGESVIIDNAILVTPTEFPEEPAGTVRLTVSARHSDRSDAVQFTTAYGSPDPNRPPEKITEAGVTGLCGRNEGFTIDAIQAKVVVVEIRTVDGNKKVRLGIDTPRMTPVHRLEVNDQIYGRPTQT